MDSAELLSRATPADLMSASIYDRASGSHVCLICGEHFEEGRVLTWMTGSSRRAGPVLLPLPGRQRAVRPLGSGPLRGDVGVRTTTRDSPRARALYEGESFKMRRCLEAFAGSGQVLCSVTCAGPASQDGLYMRLLADITALPCRASSVQDASALRGAMLVGIGCGKWYWTYAPGGAPSPAQGGLRPARPVVLRNVRCALCRLLRTSIPFEAFPPIAPHRRPDDKIPARGI